MLEARDPARPGGLSARRADRRAERHRPARGPDRSARSCCAARSTTRASVEEVREAASPASLRWSWRCTTRALPRPRSARSSRSSPTPARAGCIELAIGELGDPPRPLVWLALGSHGRRELAPPPTPTRPWRGRAMTTIQISRSTCRRSPNAWWRARRHGFTADDHGATCARPLFRARSTSWRRSRCGAAREPGREQGAGPDLAGGRRSRRVQRRHGARFGRSCARPTLGAACCG